MIASSKVVSAAAPAAAWTAGGGLRAAGSAVHALADLRLEDGRAGDPGLFGPTSLVWRLNRERLLLLGGPAALLLQIAHPLVAAGVAAHSGFEADPLGRLQSTLTTTLTVIFGDSRQVRRMSGAVRGRHRAVAGQLPERVGRFPAGTSYAATDPALLLWVHATLVHCGLQVFDRFVGPLPAADRARYYTETKPLAVAFGVPRRLLPVDHNDFLAYFSRMTAEELTVGAAALSLAPKILDGGFPAPGPVRFGRDAVTAGLLPPRVRDGYRLGWGPGQAAALAALQHAVSASVVLLPARLRFWPHYHVAQRRVGTRPPFQRPRQHQQSGATLAAAETTEDDDPSRPIINLAAADPADQH